MEFSDTQSEMSEKIRKLQSYCKYIAARFQDQAMVVNKINPFIASAMLDDLEDAVGVSGLGTDPREWE